MSNVVSIGLPRRPNLAQRQSMLLKSFALHRRDASDVYWLKENAELLNVLAMSGAQLPATALAPFEGFYEGIEERFRFFPQYYRFLLSLCLDLEDLGMPGAKGEALCARVVKDGLAEAELSDLQRAEAALLLSRRNIALADEGLGSRLDRFSERPGTFALPNKKAAYELTHLVFYRSAYGKRPFGAGEALSTSLEFAGLLAFLDQDVDLLSEICLALRFADCKPSDIWEDWLALQLHGFVFEPVATPGAGDAYHEYLVANWWSVVSLGQGFEGVRGDGAMNIQRHAAPAGPLRAMSECLYRLGSDRSRNWQIMRRLIGETLGAQAQDILEGAERSSPRFDAFFSDFARADA